MRSRSLHHTIAALVTCTAALGITNGSVSAEERRCTGSLGAVTVDNLLVPSRATCVLNGTRVKGNVRVSTGATLRATAATVIGAVQAEGHRAVTLRRGSVGNNVQLKQGGAATLVNVRVTGDIQLDANDAPLTVDRNRVRGSVQVVGNDAPAWITSNQINGNLQCKENTPAPTGSGNVVGGNKEDQCARL
jgi:hypothetical protein